MARTLRMPVTVASRKGISAVAASAAEHRVLLTSHGHTVAVVDSAERIDEDLRLVRAAALAVADAAGDLVRRRSQRFNLDEVCSRLGLDPAQVKQRAAEHSAAKARL